MRRLLILSWLAAAAVILTPPGLARADRLTDDDEEAGDARPFQHNDAMRPSPASGAEALVVPPVFEQLFPSRVKKLHDLASTHPEVYRRALRRMHRVADELRDLKLTDMEEFTRRMDALRLEGHAEQLAVKYRESKDAAEKSVIENEMRITLQKQFDKKEESQRAHVARMEREVATLRKKLQAKHDRRDKAIAKRLAELKEEDEDLDF
jgi:hypothetical protein